MLHLSVLQLKSIAANGLAVNERRLYLDSSYDNRGNEERALQKRFTMDVSFVEFVQMHSLIQLPFDSWKFAHWHGF